MPNPQKDNPSQPDNQPKELPVWATLTYILSLTAMMIAGELILRTHPTAGHVLLSVAGGILLLTMFGFAIHDAIEKKKEDSGNTDSSKRK